MPTTVIQIDQGQSITVPFQFHKTDGSFDTAADPAFNVTQGDATKIRATKNPENNRQVEIVGVAPTGGQPVLLAIQPANTQGLQQFVQVSVVAPTIDSVIIGTPTSEHTPPSWA